MVPTQSSAKKDESPFHLRFFMQICKILQVFDKILQVLEKIQQDFEKNLQDFEKIVQDKKYEFGISW